ncbi:MAG: hypothetical protein AAFQ98_27255, partial [Bacteroidota bacterium]
PACRHHRDVRASLRHGATAVGESLSRGCLERVNKINFNALNHFELLSNPTFFSELDRKAGISIAPSFSSVIQNHKHFGL